MIPLIFKCDLCRALQQYIHQIQKYKAVFNLQFPYHYSADDAIMEDYYLRRTWLYLNQNILFSKFLSEAINPLLPLSKHVC